MQEAKFTWFPKLTATVAKVPEDERGAILWALAQYGTFGIEPDLDWPLDAIFESLREDIDNSKRAISNGGRGGRGNSKGASQNDKAPFEYCETPLSDTENPPCESAYSGVCNSDEGANEESEPKPNQSIPNQSKPKRERFTPPTLQEVRDYCAEKGYTFDPEAFWSFYESKGWKVGRNPMKSWKAACVTWQKREPKKPEGGAHDEYSNL